VEQRGRAILVVDDDADIRMSLEDALQEAGFSVATAGNGQEALRVLRTCQDRIDLILLDLMMPVMNGWQFRREQQQDPHLSVIPVVVLSAGNHVAEAAASLGAATFLRKPIGMDALLRAVAQAIAA